MGNFKKPGKVMNEINNKEKVQLNSEKTEDEIGFIRCKKDEYSAFLLCTQPLRCRYIFINFRDSRFIIRLLWQSLSGIGKKFYIFQKSLTRIGSIM